MNLIYLRTHFCPLIVLSMLCLAGQLPAQSLHSLNLTADATLLPEKATQPVSLKQALTAIADRYQISLNYSEHEIATHRVNSGLIVGDEPEAEEALRGVLMGTGLQYKKIGAIDYVIRPARRLNPEKLVKPSGSALDRPSRVPPLPSIKALAVNVRGQVTGDEGEGVPGVNVLEKGTANGSITDIEGNYALNVAGNASVLVYSSIGYQTQEATVGERQIINVRLDTDTRELSEVVVTALGIEREERSLGYDVANVEGEQLRQVSQENVLSSLAGRVPGVTINQTSGPGSSMSVIIRGATSLTTDNQPLFVVNGVPMSNSLNNIAENGNGNQVDYGNAISDINPDDIASINVLKGPSAAALYGTRAGNGVIIITTKSGSRTRNWGCRFLPLTCLSGLPACWIFTIDTPTASAMGSSTKARPTGAALIWMPEIPPCSGTVR